MASREELKAWVVDEIDAHADEIVRASTTILGHPEPGFREVKTAKVVADRFAELGIPFRQNLAVTGVRAEVTGATPGPTLAILGELDSLIVNEHPHADPDTGAAHACGHHCQIGMMLGAATALSQTRILDEISGPSPPRNTSRSNTATVSAARARSSSSEASLSSSASASSTMSTWP